jgi:hypothetical protein
MGKIMRIALTTALMMATALTWADEPKVPADAAAAKTEAAAATSDEPVAQAAAEGTTAAITPAEETKEFKPPTGYRAKRVNGEQVYCTKIVVLGSRFAKEDCRTESQLRDLEAQKASMRGEMDQRNRVCSSNNGACGGN